VKIQGSIAKRLGGEEGVTLVELMWFIVLSLAVLTAALAFVASGFHQQNTTVSRTAASRTAEAGLAQLARDLREAITSVSASTTSTTTTISSYIPTPGSDATGQAVTWTCTNNNTSTHVVGPCTRTLNGTTKTLITGVQSVQLTPLSSTGTTLSLPLSSATNVAYMKITLQVGIPSQIHPNRLSNSGANNVSDVPANSNPIYLQAGADLRNFS
jgi:hypothetical protein